MANWCSNTLVFEGNPEAIEQIQQLFMAMAEKEEAEEMGQLPYFTTIYNGYFFDIYWNTDNESIFQYQTKWSPNLEIVQQIAEYYEVSFILDYEEMGNLVYGRATYQNGTLTDIYLTDEDLETYQFDEDTDTYRFEGETYDSDGEILEALLNRKTALATFKV